MSRIRFPSVALIITAVALAGCSTRSHPIETPRETMAGKNPVPQHEPHDRDGHPLSSQPAAPSSASYETLPASSDTPENSPAPELDPASKPHLVLREGRFGNVEIGMSEAEVRAALEEMGLSISREMPYGDGGKLLSLRGINFRFTREGRMFQIYALHESVPIEHGLVLNRSTVQDFEDALDTELSEFVAANGSTQFRTFENKFEIRVLPTEDDPKTAFSIMLTEKSD